MPAILPGQFNVNYIIACKAIAIVLADKYVRIYSGGLDEETISKLRACVSAIEEERDALSTTEAVDEALEKYLPLANAILTANANPSEEQ